MQYTHLLMKQLIEFPSLTCMFTALVYHTLYCLEDTCCSYYSRTGKMKLFKARPAIGGLFAKLLLSIVNDKL